MASIVYNALSGQFDTVNDQAAEIGYNNSGTSLAATDVQAALTELDADIQAIPTPITYRGTWDASTNTPTLANTDTGVEGYLYQVNVAGTVNFGAGNISFEIGDKVVNNGTEWQKWDMTDAVSSVNGFTGAVTLTTTNINEGSNLYYTDARAQAAVTGAASTVVTSNLTADRAVLSNGSGKLAVSAVTSTELGHLSGVTSAIQTQLNARALLLTPTSVAGSITLGANTLNLVDTTAARSLTLPAHNSGQYVRIKDVSFNSETNNITVTPPSGLIEGQSSLVIASDGASILLYNDGTNWFRV